MHVVSDYPHALEFLLVHGASVESREGALDFLCVLRSANRHVNMGV